jgi:transcription elongation factor S-II
MSIKPTLTLKKSESPDSKPNPKANSKANSKANPSPIPNLNLNPNTNFNLNINPSNLLPFQKKIYTKLSTLLESSELALKCESELTKFICQVCQTEPEQPKFKTNYMPKAINLCRNLDPEGSLNNDYLQPKVKSGEITPFQLVRLSDQELYPPKWKEISDRHMKDITTLDQNNKVVTQGLYYCGKCKQNKCTYYQLQTRSCDEPTTTFVTCMNCGNRWRE